MAVDIQKPGTVQTCTKTGSNNNFADEKSEIFHENFLIKIIIYYEMKLQVSMFEL